MRVLKDNDFQILENLITLNQKQTRRFCSKLLHNCYSKVTETKDFIFAEGDIPIALVAHMDTVFDKTKKHSDKTLYYDMKRGVLWNPCGAGFDDKAGIFTISKILKDGYRPHIIFTSDEEIGGLGATALTSKYPICPFQDLRYIIELDRRGSNDCVFYDCENFDFIDYVEFFGFIENFGSFSDIDIICPDWGIAGVNLSIGYENEHTTSEILHINAMFSTIKKVENMLKKGKEAPYFEYILAKRVLQKYFGNSALYTDGSFYDKCQYCGNETIDYELIPVKTINGEVKNICLECLSEKDIRWCCECNCAYEYAESMDDFKCNDCVEKEQNV